MRISSRSERTLETDRERASVTESLLRPYTAVRIDQVGPSRVPKSPSRPATRTIKLRSFRCGDGIHWAVVGDDQSFEAAIRCDRPHVENPECEGTFIIANGDVCACDGNRAESFVEVAEAMTDRPRLSTRICHRAMSSDSAQLLLTATSRSS